MKLTDLYIEWIQTILEYLPYADLLNAADSSKRLLHAARFVFLENFGDRISIDTNNMKEPQMTASRYSPNQMYIMTIIGSKKITLPFSK